MTLFGPGIRIMEPRDPVWAGHISYHDVESTGLVTLCGPGILCIFMEKQDKQEHVIIKDQCDKYMNKLCMMYHEHVIFCMFQYFHHGLSETHQPVLSYSVVTSDQSRLCRF